MSGRFHTIEARGARLMLDLAVGHVRSFALEQGGRTVAPLHTAPWVDDPVVGNDESILGNLRFLSGDFFCAPFGLSDVEKDSPVSHGWPANSPWRLAGEERAGDAVTARLLLLHPVMGAEVEKAITLRDGHPFAYVRHTFRGGHGAVSAASHAMTRFDAPGRVFFSAKAYADLPRGQSEPDPQKGRSLLASDRRVTDLTRIPLADGGAADLSHYPIGMGHEDFLMLVEAAGSRLGWAAALRPGAGDIMLSLKSPADYPVTFLWYSNGGRFYPPWNGRHIGVLGIEEGRAWSGYGHAASIAPNPMSEAGIPTSVTLGVAPVSLRHVVGGLALPAGWSRVDSVAAAAGQLTIAGDGGTLSAPFDATFLA